MDRFSVRPGSIDINAVPIACISLDRRPDRWNAFQKRAIAAGFHHATRKSAVDAKTFNAETHPSVSLVTSHNLHYGSRRSPYEIDVPGAVGASLSHFQIWEDVIHTDRYTIVFEDDTPIPINLRTRIQHILSILPQNWDVILLHRTSFEGGKSGCSAVAKELDERDRANGWQSCDSLAGAHAYIVSPAGARKLLARAYPIELHVDAFMAFMARLGHINMLWHPSVDVGGDWTDSDIHHQGGRIVSLPTDMERAGVYALDTPGLLGLLVLATVTGAVVGAACVMAWTSKLKVRR